MKSLQKRLEKAEKKAIKTDYDPVAFIKNGQGIENYRIGPKTIIFIDDIED